INHISVKEKEEIRIKLRALDPIIKGKKINIKEHLQTLREEENIQISTATFYNWKKIWEVDGVNYLFNGKPGPKKRRTEAEILETLEDIMEEELYTGEDIPYRYIYRQYKSGIQEINQLRNKNDQMIIRSFQTIWRVIKKKRDHYREMKAREGRVVAD